MWQQAVERCLLIGVVVVVGVVPVGVVVVVIDHFFLVQQSVELVHEVVPVGDGLGIRSVFVCVAQEHVDRCVRVEGLGFVAVQFVVVLRVACVVEEAVFVVVVCFVVCWWELQSPFVSSPKRFVCDLVHVTQNQQWQRRVGRGNVPAWLFVPLVRRE